MDTALQNELEIQASAIVERLEEAVEKATEAVTSLEDGGEPGKDFNETDLGLKGTSWKNVQGFLPPTGKPKEEIWKVFQDLVVFEPGDEEDDEPMVAAVAPLSPLAKSTLTIHSINAYCHTLDPAYLHKLNRRITQDVTRWMARLFRLHTCNAFYHDEPLEGLVRITRMVLHLRYPKYLEDGYFALTHQQPVLYGEIFNSLGLLQHLCRQIGLPLSCLSPIPANSSGSMDTAALKRQITQDISSGRLPLLALADAGSPVTGQVDDIPQLYEICKQHNMWLHLRGHGLAALPIITSPNVPSLFANSFSLTPGSWFGLPSLPSVTLYQPLESTPAKTVGASREGTLPLIAGLVPDHLQKRLASLPLWFALQGMGHEGIKERIKCCLSSTHKLWYKISKLPNLRLLSRSPTFTEESLPIDQLTPLSPTNQFSLIEMSSSIATTVAFQFIPDVEKDKPFVGRVPPYFDKLNSWVGQILQRDVPQVNLEICDIDSAGFVLRLCPLEGILTITNEHVDTFLNCLVQQLEILSATVRLKAVFQTQVKSHPQLELIEIQGWAGLGGCRFLPRAPDGEPHEFTLNEINNFNSQIVAKLRNTDSAFSLGEGQGGVVCVRFGMVTADTNIDELLGLVLSIGKEVEKNVRDLEHMVAVLKKGIEAATIDLKKETEDRIWQDGILRHVPVFGSIVNWWAPKSSEAGVKGRSLNLQAGVVESTENIYRYHMQLQQGAASPPGTKSPPQPQVQTPIVTSTTSAAHSRSSSHESHSSHSSNPTAILPQQDS